MTYDDQTGMPGSVADIASPLHVPGRAGGKQSLVDIVLSHLCGAVGRGEIAIGDKLPTEFELAEMLGVSRTPVREAIKVLEVAGLVEIRPGAGTFVKSRVETSLAQLLLFQIFLRDSTPRKMMEARRIFERGCAELAAERRTEADLTAMRESIDHLAAIARDPATPLKDLLEADLEFHRIIYRSSRNELIATMANFVLNMVAPWMEESLRRAGPEQTVHLHEMLLTMIEARNAGGAREISAVLAAADENMEHWRKTLE